MSDYGGVISTQRIERDVPKNYPNCEASEKEIREARIQTFILRMRNDEDIWTGESLSAEEKADKNVNITCPSKTNEGGKGSEKYDLYCHMGLYARPDVFIIPEASDEV